MASAASLKEFIYGREFILAPAPCGLRVISTTLRLSPRTPHARLRPRLRSP